MSCEVCNCCKLWRKETVMFSIINIFLFFFLFPSLFLVMTAKSCPHYGNTILGRGPDFSLIHTDIKKKKKKKILRETFVIIMDTASCFNLFCVSISHCCPLFLLLYNQICWCIRRNASCMFDKWSRSTCC